MLEQTGLAKFISPIIECPSFIEMHDVRRDLEYVEEITGMCVVTFHHRVTWIIGRSFSGLCIS